MSIDPPTFDPDTVTPEKVDNSNVIARTLVEQIAADAGTDTAVVVEALAADGRIAETDVDAAADKGWIDVKDVEAVKGRIVEAKAANTLIRDAEAAARDNADNL